MNIKLFCDTYIYKKDERHHFLLLCHESKPCPDTYVAECNRKPSRFRIGGVDGVNHYMIPISVGFGKHLSKQKRIESVFSLLSSQLTEEGIKNLYPDLYLEYRNRVTMKKNITQYQHMKHLQNIGKLEKHDGYIAHITQNMGMREASRLSIH